jgi:hypothetical protein
MRRPDDIKKENPISTANGFKILFIAIGVFGISWVLFFSLCWPNG